MSATITPPSMSGQKTGSESNHLSHLSMGIFLGHFRTIRPGRLALNPSQGQTVTVPRTGHCMA
jgi:hypothetical protein